MKNKKKIPTHIKKNVKIATKYLLEAFSPKIIGDFFYRAKAEDGIYIYCFKNYMPGYELWCWKVAMLDNNILEAHLLPMGEDESLALEEGEYGD